MHEWSTIREEIERIANYSASMSANFKTTINEGLFTSCISSLPLMQAWKEEKTIVLEKLEPHVWMCSSTLNIWDTWDTFALSLHVDVYAAANLPWIFYDRNL